ncbi:MAG: FecR domain-containing protein [Chloroflexi bacterium]|nr:FecR domain-containing protein [Chloroflexota bacterium]
MARKPETVAWITIGASFFVFCLLVAGLVISGRWYLANATQGREARVAVVNGSLLVKGKDQFNWVSSGPQTILKAGDSLKTDGASQVLITLFDNSTIILYSSTQIRLDTLASAQFSPYRERILLFQESGKSHIGVAPSPKGEKDFQVVTPQATMVLQEGSFAVRVNNEASQLKVQERGRASVVAKAQEVALKEKQRTEVVSGSPPASPQEAKEELIFNGDFSQGLKGWRTGNFLGFPEGQDVEGEVAVADGGGSQVRFQRRGSKGTHSETYVYQEIERDVSDYSSLYLTIKFKLVYQSLSGGGYMGSEYPVALRMDYRSDRGDTFRIYGFYYHNEFNNRTDNGLLVPRDQWVTYTVPQNLMSLTPKPQQILSLQVSASGWDYESLVGEVSLAGE